MSVCCASDTGRGERPYLGVSPTRKSLFPWRLWFQSRSIVVSAYDKGQLCKYNFAELGRNTHPLHVPAVSLGHVMQLYGVRGRSCGGSDSSVPRMRSLNESDSHMMLFYRSLDAGCCRRCFKRGASVQVSGARGYCRWWDFIG